jgi:hypothetical protein
VLLSPLANWKGQEESVAEGMEIRRLRPAESSALEASDTILHHHDIGELAKDCYWLCYDFENDYPADNVRYRRRQDAAFKLMLHAMYSIQILLPIGATNLFILYRKTEAGLALELTTRRQAFLETIWGRQCRFDPSFRDEIAPVLDRIRQTFQKPILRLQIPIWLLEQGMGAPDRHIRILLWATGLDALTRSGGTVAFGERLGQLLGPETEIFPPDAANRRPKYRVIDVVGDLYQLRNEMAHGLPFHEKFRKKREFLAEGGVEELAAFRYDHVLEECAVFLLSKTLREVLLRNRVFDVHTMCWSEHAALSD